MVSKNASRPDGNHSNRENTVLCVVIALLIAVILALVAGILTACTGQSTAQACLASAGTFIAAGVLGIGVVRLLLDR